MQRKTCASDIHTLHKNITAIYTDIKWRRNINWLMGIVEHFAYNFIFNSSSTNYIHIYKNKIAFCQVLGIGCWKAEGYFFSRTPTFAGHQFQSVGLLIHGFSTNSYIGRAQAWLGFFCVWHWQPTPILLRPKVHLRRSPEILIQKPFKECAQKQRWNNAVRK